MPTKSATGILTPMPILAPVVRAPELDDEGDTAVLDAANAGLIVVVPVVSSNVEVELWTGFVVGVVVVVAAAVGADDEDVVVADTALVMAN